VNSAVNSMLPLKRFPSIKTLQFVVTHSAFYCAWENYRYSYTLLKLLRFPCLECRFIDVRIVYTVSVFETYWPLYGQKMWNPDK